MASTHALLNSVLRMKSALILFSSEDSRICINMSALEWDFVLEMEALLTSVLKLLKEVQREDDPTSSLTWPLAMKAKEMCCEDIISVIDGDSISMGKTLQRKPKSASFLTENGVRFRSRLKNELDFRFFEPTEDEMICMMVDPRLGELRFLKNDEWISDGKRYLKRRFLEFVNQGQPTEKSSFTDDPDPSTPGPFRVKNFRPSSSSHPIEAQNELDRWFSIHIDWNDYISSGDVIGDDCDMFDLISRVRLCDFWKRNEDRFPTIALIAKTHLSLPSAQSFQERVFSTGKDFIGYKRTMLSAQRFRKSVILRHNMKFMESRRTQSGDAGSTKRQKVGSHVTGESCLR